MVNCYRNDNPPTFIANWILSLYCRPGNTLETAPKYQNVGHRYSAGRLFAGSRMTTACKVEIRSVSSIYISQRFFQHCFAPVLPFAPSEPVSYKGEI
jgi:hypothetical protein